MITSGTYFVFPSESLLQIDSTDGIVKIVLPTAQAISSYMSGTGGQVPEVLGYSIVGATVNPVRFYRGGGLLWNNDSEYIEITTDGNGTISSSNGIQSISESVLNSGSSLNYIEYLALITQEAAGSPSAIVLRNTLGIVPSFSFNSTGDFTLTATGVLTLDKVAILTGSSIDAGCTVKLTHSSVNSINIKTYDAGKTLKNTIITKYPIHIIVSLV